MLLLVSILTSLIEALTGGSNLHEILWNFNRYPPASGKRVTLAKNPHFYDSYCLPITSSSAVQDEFTAEPMIDCQYANIIYVLTNKPGRVFFEIGDNSRAFENVWQTHGILIFKSQCLI